METSSGNVESTLVATDYKSTSYKYFNVPFEQYISTCNYTLETLQVRIKALYKI